MGNNLTLFAGKKALEIIGDEGLRPERISTVASAAGGPKWLVLNGLDRALFGTFFCGRNTPLHLVGSSIGAWRFAALAQPDPMAALGRLEKAYIGQRYRRRPSPARVTRESLWVMGRYLTDSAMEEILAHPWFRLNIITAKSRHLTTARHALPLAMGLGAAAGANLVGRQWLSLFFDRVIFHDPRSAPPFLPQDRFDTRCVPLAQENLKKALLASGSIPLVMSGVEQIPGAPAGVYRDGGIIDYHLDLSYGPGDGIVLFPHYTERMIPGWLDKGLAWRKPDSANLDRVLMVAPSEGFVQSLPLGKISDRNDFYRFAGADWERMAYWHTVVSRGRLLAEEFMELAASKRIRERVRPFSEAGIVRRV
ncbi:MAG: patatin-like phospholipase family protein [Desulfobacterales bacterium]|nr:patatin-like phospholipase family protein [Desulfobacterales bacterium]